MHDVIVSIFWGVGIVQHLMGRKQPCTQHKYQNRILVIALVVNRHKDERKNIPVDEICKAFVQTHPRILFQASLIDDCSTQI